MPKYHKLEKGCNDVCIDLLCLCINISYISFKIRYILYLSFMTVHVSMYPLSTFDLLTSEPCTAGGAVAHCHLL